MRKPKRKVIEWARKFWEGIRQTAHRDGTPFIVISPPAKWQTGPVGSVGYFYTLDAALTNARGLLQHHGEHATVHHLVGGQLQRINWESRGGGKLRHSKLLTTGGVYKAAGLDARGALVYCKHKHQSREHAVACASENWLKSKGDKRKFDRVVEMDGGRVWEVLDDAYGTPRAGKAMHQGAYGEGRGWAIANRADLGDTPAGNKRVSGGKKRHSTSASRERAEYYDGHGYAMTMAFQKQSSEGFPPYGWRTFSVTHRGKKQWYVVSPALKDYGPFKDRHEAIVKAFNIYYSWG